MGKRGQRVDIAHVLKNCISKSAFFQCKAGFGREGPEGLKLKTGGGGQGPLCRKVLIYGKMALLNPHFSV